MEGREVWDEAIDFLNEQEPLAALRRVRCLDCSANYMVNDMSNPRPPVELENEHLAAHLDSQGRLTSGRLTLSCLIETGGENIAAGSFSARSTILQLIVDDDVPGRGHRKNIFAEFTQVGIASAFNQDYGTVTVHDFLY